MQTKIIAIYALSRPRDPRILGELVDVAIWRAEVHPRISALVFNLMENLNTASPELAGRRIDIVHQKSDDRSGREVTVHLTAGSKDFYFAAVGQLEHPKFWKIKVRSKAEDVSKEPNRLLKVVRTGTDPGKLDYLHALVDHRGSTTHYPATQAARTADYI